VRNLFLIIILAFPVTLKAYAFSGQVDAGANTIPVAFDNGDAGSKMHECRHARQIMIHNETNDRIAWGIGLVGTVPNSVHGYVMPNNTVAKDAVTISAGSYIYIRSDTGAPISAGTVSAECW